MTQKIDLHSTIDASVWAKEFCKLNTAADEGAMLSWFANAIMTGFDEANRRASMRGACAVSPAESVQSVDASELAMAMHDAVLHGTGALIGGKFVPYAEMLLDPKIADAHAEGRRSALEELHPQWLKEKERADRLDSALKEWLDKTQWVQAATAKQTTERKAPPGWDYEKQGGYLIGYGACTCVLSQHCDGKCKPIFEYYITPPLDNEAQGASQATPEVADLPPLPKPNTHCFDEDTKKDVWSHSADQMRDYARAALAATTAAEPVAWVRQHPDGRLTDEYVSDELLESVRKNSGAWVPLYRAAPPQQVDTGGLPG